jgi:hypothetical protein
VGVVEASPMTTGLVFVGVFFAPVLLWALGLWVFGCDELGGPLWNRRGR